MLQTKVNVLDQFLVVHHAQLDVGGHILSVMYSLCLVTFL